MAGEVASRREVRLGFTEGDSVEILEGVAEGEQVVVVGQDGLSDGTPIEVLGVQGGEAWARSPATGTRDSGAQVPGGQAPGAQTPGEQAPGVQAPGGQGPGGPPAFGGRGGFDPSQLTPERLEAIKQRMRQRGLSDEQIEERLKQMRERAGGGG